MSIYVACTAKTFESVQSQNSNRYQNNKTGQKSKSMALSLQRKTRPIFFFFSFSIVRLNHPPRGDPRNHLFIGSSMIELGHVEGGGKLRAGYHILWVIRVLSWGGTVVVETSRSGEWLRDLHGTPGQRPAGTLAPTHG